MKVLLAGEGPTELGDWFKEPAYRSSPCAPGVVETLARSVADGDWTVVDAMPWRSIRKYRSGGHRQAETKNVLGMVLSARENGCGAVLFVRDRDRSTEREADVEAGIRDAAVNHDLADVRVAGGVAVEKIESWLLALLGERKTEGLSDPKAVLEHRGYDTCEAKVGLIRERGLAAMPDDATSLRRWLDRARKALGSAPTPTSP